MNIQLPTGLTVNVSVYEYLFILKDEDMDLFYQQCIADNIGSYIENPFSGRNPFEKIHVDLEDQPED